MIYIYILNEVGKMEQRRRTPLLIVIVCVNVLSSLFLFRCFHIFL